MKIHPVLPDCVDSLEKTLIVFSLIIKKYDICTMIQIETILDILAKGFIIGVVVSAPLGPVGVLCIQRTLNKGRWYGFVTGLGASLSDIAYALFTGYGMSFVFDYINKNIFYLQLLGSVMLLLFGVYTFRSNPVRSIRPASSHKGSYFHNFITAFFVTLSNPLIIFLFIGLFARLAFVQPGVLVFEEITGYVAIVLGALSWWLGITYFVNKVRTKFNLRGIWILNRVIGSIVVVVSVIGFIYTLLGESIY
ncbi:amino acid exporter [gut metagenome]|uniref:Amino acid exporter n=1 Tax=gut metagenome TaxID=749906 RepID=J9GPV9_9ZZZZ